MLLFISLLLFLIAGSLFWISTRQRRSTGLPAGRVIYTDTRAWGKVEKPLYDPEAGLTGKPDYLMKQADGRTIIPVEVKSGRAPSVPYDSHIFQLAVYCYLVEREYGERPPYGILRYRDRTFEIDYTPALEADLFSLMEEMRKDQKRLPKRDAEPAPDRAPDRSHQEPQRCAHCGYRSICDQRL